MGRMIMKIKKGENEAAEEGKGDKVDMGKWGFWKGVIRDVLNGCRQTRKRTRDKQKDERN